MLDDAKRRYDTIIIDSPPVLAGADARLLAKLADATIFVVHWSKTRRETVRHCLKLLESAEATVSGALLTMVDTRKHRHYGYGDADTYTGEMEKYYVGQN